MADSQERRQTGESRLPLTLRSCRIRGNKPSISPVNEAGQGYLCAGSSSRAVCEYLQRMLRRKRDQ